MVTKSKKTKVYRLHWKVTACCLFFVSAVLLFICGVVVSNLTSRWKMSELMNMESYYDTEYFHNHFFYEMDCVVGADIYYQSEERILAGDCIDRESLINDFKSYYWIKDGIITSNTEINDTYDDLIVTGEIPESLQENFEEYLSLVQNNLPAFRDITIQNQLDEYRTFRKHLDSVVNFYYYVEDAKGNVIAGNTDPSYLNQVMERTIVLSGDFTSDSLSDSYLYSYSNSFLSSSGCRIYAGIADPMEEGDEFYTEMREFNLAKESVPILFVVGMFSVLMGFACFIYLLRVCGQSEKGGKVQLLLTDHVFNEIHFFFVLFLAFVSVIAAARIIDTLYYLPAGFWPYILVTILGLLYLLDVAVGLNYLLSVTRQIKAKCFLHNTIISALIRKIASFFSESTFRGWMVFIMLIYGLGNCFLTLLLMNSLMSYHYAFVLLTLALLIIYNLFCMWLFMRGLRSLKAIMISAKETSKGNIEYQLEVDKISPSFQNFAVDIANIQGGLKEAVKNAVRGERMKTELITNVSHDLKTPLTSIITYADLLHKEHLENENAAHYAEVIYEKSYRLKQLIEDLIEASKASSGNLKVNKMCMDFREVAMQAIGEMEEKLHDAGLEIKLSCPYPVYIDGDGRHMWRILENLLSNVVKYALPNSRVYIDIFAEDGTGVLIMKNISAAPMDFDAATLTERFVRGDASRTTEGSGLGLSITQSLVELQQGIFAIQVDGDLFKAIVEIPLYRDPETGEAAQERIMEEYRAKEEEKRQQMEKEKRAKETEEEESLEEVQDEMTSEEKPPLETE